MDIDVPRWGITSLMRPPDEGSVETSIFVVIARIRSLVDALNTAAKVFVARSFVPFQAPESFKLIRRKVRSGKAQAPTEIYRLVNL